MVPESTTELCIHINVRRSLLAPCPITIVSNLICLRNASRVPTLPHKQVRCLLAFFRVVQRHARVLGIQMAHAHIWGMMMLFTSISPEK